MPKEKQHKSKSNNTFNTFSNSSFISWCLEAGKNISNISNSFSPLKEVTVRDEDVKIVNTAGTHNCGGACVIKAHIKDGTIIRLSTDDEPDTPEFPQIRACARGRAYIKTNCHPDRLKYPMKRTGNRGQGKFQRITWKEAVDIITDELIRVKKTYGPSARFTPIGGPWGSIYPSGLAKRLLSLDGGYLDTYNDYSTPQQDTITNYTYGSVMIGNSQEDMLNSKLIVLWGFNSAETIMGSLCNYFLRKAKDKGTKITVIDPRYTDTVVAFADQWISPLPTTDAALADAMAYVMITENLHDQGFLDKCCIGFDENHMPENIPPNQSYKSYCLGIADGVPKTPEWGEKITRVPAEVIRNFARELSSNKPANIMLGWGTQRHANGEQQARCTMLLAAMTGNVGISGGSTSGAAYLSRKNIPYVPIPPNPFAGKIPSFLWTQAAARGIEMTSKDGVIGVDRLPSNIKLILCLGSGNLMNQHSDCNKTAELLSDESKIEFIVVSDNFMTPSAKFADILLPGDNFFERDNIKKAWVYGDWVLYSNKLLDPPFECRNEYDWLSEIAERLGFKEKFTQGRNLEGWCRWVTDQIRSENLDFPVFEDFKEKGIYRWRYSKPYIAFEKEAENPQIYPFSTPSGKIELFSKRLFEMDNSEAIPAIPKYIKADEGPDDPLIEKYPLQCISWHHRYRSHSIHYNNPWLNEAQSHVIWINPEDAKSRGIKNKDKVKVFNERGTMVISARITVRIIPGVVGVPHGTWYNPDENGLDQNGCINTLTSQKPTALAHANPQHTNLVEVVKYK